MTPTERIIAGYCIMTERGTFIAVGASLEPREVLSPAVTTGMWPLPEQAHSRRASCGDMFGPLTVCPVYVERS